PRKLAAATGTAGSAPSAGSHPPGRAAIHGRAWRLDRPSSMSEPGESRFVRYEAIDGVSVITLDRQPINVYDGAFHVEFQGAWQQARRDPDTTVVVMRATGRHFCAGANLRDPQPEPEGAEVLSPWDEIRLIRETMKPTIAAVQGGCIGG